MSNPIHTLDRWEAISTVFGGLPFNAVEARDALEAIQHEFRIYEAETRELYAFVGRVRRFFEREEAPGERDIWILAEELDTLAERVQTAILTLPRSQMYAVLDDTASLSPKIMD
jgi:hypothetical protein